MYDSNSRTTINRSRSRSRDREDSYRSTYSDYGIYDKHTGSYSEIGGDNRGIDRRGEERETDPRKIEQRLKQLQYGYNTVGYDRYIQEVPKRNRGTFKTHPRTPDPYVTQSKRSWDGRINSWRRDLHRWDPVGLNEGPEIKASEDGSTANGTQERSSDSMIPEQNQAARDDDDDGEDVL